MSLHRPASCPCCGGSLRRAFDRRRFLLGAGGVAALALSPRVCYRPDDADYLLRVRPQPAAAAAQYVCRRGLRRGRQFQGARFRLSRGNTNGPAYAAAAAELLEFDANGKYIREIGHNLYAWSFAHTVKVDGKTTSGSPTRARTWSSSSTRRPRRHGLRPQARGLRRGHRALRHPKPPLPPVDGMFRQVTDVAWDAAGNTYISDGYINSRVAKVDKDGNWLKSWGDPGTGLASSIRRTASLPTRDTSTSPTAAIVASRCSMATATLFARSPSTCPFRPTLGPRSARAGRAERHRNHGARRSLGYLHHARAEPGVVQFGRLSRPHLQAQPRWQGAGLSRQRRQTTQTVRLDPRNGLSFGE